MGASLPMSQYGAPSGIDAHGVVSTSPLWFHGGTVEALPTGAELTFVLADTGGG